MAFPNRTTLARSLACIAVIAVCAGALLGVSGCASKPKNAGRIYAGEGPSMKYHGRETAGGPLGGW
ncbi:MAG TPA: hypothetical protein VF614_17240 [Chthoniobacteraceae bacterium]|jgi:hypothetical protein